MKHHTCTISVNQSQIVYKVEKIYLIKIYMRSLRQYGAMVKTSWILLTDLSLVPRFAN